jgi:hypothetical protein
MTYIPNQFIARSNQFLLSPLDFNAKYDGVNDDSQAHQEMFDYLRSLASPIRKNCIIQLPAGKSVNKRALHIPLACVIQGAGGAGSDFCGTQLLFEYGVHGVIIDSSESSKDGTNAQWCVLRDIYIAAKGQENNSLPVLHKNGLTLRTRAHIENVIVSGFSGDGFHIVSAHDGNVDDANRLWIPGHEYTDGDWVNALGHDRNAIVFNENYIIEANPGGRGTDVIQFSTTGSNEFKAGLISVGDIFLIPSGSSLAGTSNSNVGMYIIGGVNKDILLPPTSKLFQARKISDTSIFVDSGTFKTPVNSGPAAVQSINDVQILAKVDNRFVCIKSGISDSTSLYLNNTQFIHYPNQSSLNDGTVLWKETGTSTGNANNWYMQYCRSEANGRHGFFIQGDETNAGCAIQCDASVNTGWGFFDNSFLGNTWIACHAATNVMGPYRTSSHGNCFSTFIGCYSEKELSPSIIYAPSTVVGGIHYAGIVGNTSSFIGNQMRGEVSFSDGISPSPISIGNNVGDHFMALHHPSELVPYYIEMTGANYGNEIKMRFSNFAISTIGTQNKNSGRYPGRSKLTQAELFLGSRCNYIGYNRDNNLCTGINDLGLYAPATFENTDNGIGVFEKGDRIYKYNPNPGDYEGWIVTESGTTGTNLDLAITYRAIRNGSNDSIIVLDTPVSMSSPGRYLLINGTKYKIISIGNNGYELTLNEAVPVPATGFDIKYAEPEFKRFGQIDGGIEVATAPGNVTQNARRGVIKIPAAPLTGWDWGNHPAGPPVSVITVTNALLAQPTGKYLRLTLQTIDESCLSVRGAITTNTITIKPDRYATNEVMVLWEIVE